MVNGQLQHHPVKELNNVIYEEEEEESLSPIDDYNSMNVGYLSASNEVKIEYMRLLDTETLISLLVEMIHDSVTLPFLRFINITRGKNTSILLAPSKEDKLILLQTIISYLSLYTNRIDYLIDDNCKYLTKLYNDLDMFCINGDCNIKFFHNLFFINEYIEQYKPLYDANICDKVFDILECFKNKTPLSEKLSSWYRIQMFIFASFWMDMDQLLIYLYDYMTNQPEA